MKPLFQSVFMAALLASGALASMVTVTGTGRITNIAGNCASSFVAETFSCSADGPVDETWSSLFYQGSITISNPTPLSSTSCYSGTEFCGLVSLQTTVTLRQHSDDSCGSVGIGGNIYTEFGNDGYGCLFERPSEASTVSGVAQKSFFIYGQPLNFGFAIHAATLGRFALGHSDIELDFGSLLVTNTTGTGMASVSGNLFPQAAPTPEPATLLTLGGALLGLIFLRRGSLLRQKG